MPIHLLSYAKFTYKQALKIALEEVEKFQLKGVGIIINGIRLGKRNYGFGKGYGYGYGYGYEVMDTGTGTGTDGQKYDKENKKSGRKTLKWIVKRKMFSKNYVCQLKSLKLP